MEKHTTIARKLRNNMTEAEKYIWYMLRSKNIRGYKFRRQQPIGKYIVDFVCLETKLIIEIDGGQHNVNKEYDIERDKWLQEQGFKILRFWNSEVMESRTAVLEKIIDTLPLPLPSREGNNNGLSLPRRWGGLRERSKNYG